MISGHTNLELCTAEYGSHKMTFWIYFGLRLAFQWAIIGVFSIFDGASVQLANEHGGTYSEILRYGLMAAVISTFLPSLVMKKTASKTEGDFHARTRERTYYRMSPLLADPPLVDLDLGVWETGW